MKHTNFDESNKVYRGQLEGSGDLHVYEDTDQHGYNFIISAWDGTREEIINFLLYRRIWLHVWGNGQPHVYMGAVSPFVASKRAVSISDKEKADALKMRLIRAFLAEQDESTLDLEHDETVECFEKVLSDFLEYLIDRGEKDV